MISKVMKLIKYFPSKIKKKQFYKKLSKNGTIFDNSNVFGYGSSLLRSKFGFYSGCNTNCIINDTLIGNFVNIAWNVTIGPRSHIYTNFTTHDFIYLKGEHIYSGGIDGSYINKIGHDVWIGCNVTIMTGVEIGNGAIIAAGSVVTKSIPAYAIVGGNPSRFIKWRFTENQRKKLVEINWYEWELEKIIENKQFLEHAVDFNIEEFKKNIFKRRKDIETR